MADRDAPFRTRATSVNQLKLTQPDWRDRRIGCQRRPQIHRRFRVNSREAGFSHADDDEWTFVVVDRSADVAGSAWNLVTQKR